jgi:CRISPR-associated protein (Cas_Csy4)
MHYTDTLLFQGADPDGISDATSRLLAVLHGINRAHGTQGDYLLSIAFPRWQTPTMSAHKRLSGGTTGPILRVFGPRPLLDMFNQHTLMQSLIMEGRAEPGKVLSTPDNSVQWVSYTRYHRKEKAASKSYQRRHDSFIEQKKQAAKTQPSTNNKNSVPKPEPYVYLKILRKGDEPVLLPVQEKIVNSSNKPEQPLRINSWGLTTEGVLPYF